MYAAGYNYNPEVIEVLLDNGADVNGRNEYRKTALMIAAWKNNSPEVINVLLDNGANGRRKCNDWKTASDFAKDNENIKGTDAYWRLNDAQY